MFDNHLYNLVAQIAEEHKSLWRIQNYYIKDSNRCDECIKLWEGVAADKEAHIGVLEEKLKDHI